MSTFKIFELRQRFRKSVEYLWRYRIFLAQCTGWKWQTFKCCGRTKLPPGLCKSKIPAHLKLSNQMPPPLKRSVLSQRFQKSVEYPWRYGIFPGTVYRLKVANFQILSIRKFSPCHCKSKIPAHLKLYTQMPSRKSFEMRQRFRKSFEYLGRYCIFLAQFTGWKWQTFKCCRCAMFSPCHCKSKTPAHLKFSTQMPTLKIFELRQRFRKSVEYLRRYRVFGGTVYRLKVENFQMLSMGKVFTLSLQK